MDISIKSSSFSPNMLIPAQYTCDGSNISPPLKWQDASSNAQSYVLIVDDPDAPSGTWVHWLLFNIPGSVRELTEAMEAPEGSVNGRNSWGQTGYMGPCPPSGRHHYHFKLYALDTVLNLDASATKQDVEEAMQNHIIAKGEVIGFYRE